MLAYESECGAYKVYTKHGGILKTKYRAEYSGANGGFYTRGKFATLPEAKEWIDAHKASVEKLIEESKNMTGTDKVIGAVALALFVGIPVIFIIWVLF